MGKKLTGVRIKERDLEELERLAKDDDETVSFLIRQAIPEFLDRRRKATKCKYRFYPTPEQEHHLARVFGHVRFVYIGILSKRKIERMTYTKRRPH